LFTAGLSCFQILQSVTISFIVRFTSLDQPFLPVKNPCGSVACAVTQVIQIWFKEIPGVDFIKQFKPYA
jgi:hypothetical protein